MIDFLKNIFVQPITAKPTFDFPEAAMEEIKKINRHTLQMVENWIDEDAFKQSCFNYGVPDFIKTEINKPIGNGLTYTDLIQFISQKHFEKINYFEIGVSVGKNFLQVVNFHNNGQFVGFDIEEINPVMEKKFNFVESEEWATKSKSIKKSPSSLKTYKFKNSVVKYLCADVWDEQSWAKLQGQKFNMVFSDALHTPKAILFEFEMLVKYNLLNDKFVIVWDDLVGKMQNSFYKIIRKYDKQYNIKDIYLMNINGWVGQNEAPHTVGIISNFKL
ncbi:MAG TPA: hypothetical protein PK504_10210 [Ferruginibacter sp.]|nr:hypothetical protein [Ferruginibacter sp.]HRE63544.1 hypothetical protein [Ferruginibacter sp.]